MKVYICDDELQMLKSISEKVKVILPDCTIEEFSDSRALLEGLKPSGCDLLLLDIDMPKVSGLDIARQLDLFAVKPLLVFVTSHDELVYDSLTFHPFGFVRKGYIDEELERTLKDCRRELSQREIYFTFKSGCEDIRLKISEMLYFESQGNYLNLYTADQVYRIRNTIAAVEETLSEKGFIRFHRGFLVNQQAVKVLGTEEAQLVTGDKIPIGRSYGEEAKRQLVRYMRK